MVSYVAAGTLGFDAFDNWLRADPVHRDDALLLLDAATLVHQSLAPLVSRVSHSPPLGDSAVA